MTYVDIFKRLSCVTCSTVPTCPTCKDNEQCILTTQTCNECAKTYCSPIESLSSGNTKKKVGAIAGGVTGFVVLAALVGFFIFYKYYYRSYRYKKEEDEEFKHQIGDDNMVRDIGDTGLTPRVRDSGVNDANLNSHRMSQVTLSTMALSVLTKASNVIPIAYIPGVTVKYQQKKPTPSIFSDIDNASIIGGGVAGSDQSGSNTTTAIRAKPRLVNMDTDESGSNDGIPKTAVSIINLGGVKTVKIAGTGKSLSLKQKQQYQPGLQTDFIQEEEEEEEEEEPEKGKARTTLDEKVDFFEEPKGKEDGEESVFDLSIGLDDTRNPLSPFDNAFEVQPVQTASGAVLKKTVSHDSATSTSSADSNSIEGLSDDDDYDPKKKYV